MLYRVLLGTMLVLAVVLTLNERSQEERARRNSEATLAVPTIDSAIARSAPPSAGSLATRPALPFAPHRVRVRRDIDLLRAPEPTAPKVEGLSLVPAGIPANAVEERNGWYLLDVSVTRGWAPVEAVDEP